MGGSLNPGFTLVCNEQKISAADLPAWATQHLDHDAAYVSDLAQFITEWLNADSYLAVKTSGSTGTPKVQRVAKTRMQASAAATNTFFELGPNSTALLALSTNYIAGKMMVVRAFIGGYTLHVQAPEKNPLANLKELLDFAPLVPMQAQAGIQHLSNVRKLLLGGAPVTDSLRNELVKAAGETQIFQSYGMTETLSHVALRELTAAEGHYTCLPGITVTEGKRGNLVIHAPDIADAAVETNDAAKMLTPDTFEWLGRLDFVINSGGVKIHPEVVEEKLAPFLNVPFFVHHRPDVELGQAVILVLEGNEITHVLPTQALEKLHPYERPKDVYTVPEFNYTETGKIKRSETIAAHLLFLGE